MSIIRTMRTPRTSLAGRLSPASAIVTFGIPEPNTGCLLWSGPTQANCYGAIKCDGRWQLAHRVAYQLAFGPFPDELCVCHKCDTPGCIEPAHLFLGTNADNHRDKVNKQRQPRGETNGKAKLTANEVEAIRRLYATGKYSQADLARQYGLRRQSIDLIVTGVNWRHVGGPRTPAGSP